VAHHTIYHAVDLMHESPRHYSGPILAGEQRLAASNCPAVASSKVVAQHLEDVGFSEVRLWENVADVQLFVDAARLRTRRPSVVLFAGNLSPFKVDFDLLERVASLPDCELHLAGPAAIDGSETPDVTRLRAAGAIFHGPLAPRQLAELAAEAAVGVIPYLLNDYTAGVFPMKLYEYLSAGAAVVSTALPSLADRESSDVVIARSAADFLQAIRDNVALPDGATVRRRQQAAADASWQVRGAAIRDAVRDSFATPRLTLSKAVAQ
jgi:glycosyltransferase involved in cell wall biosynthesis